MRTPPNDPRTRRAARGFTLLAAVALGMSACGAVSAASHRQTSRRPVGATLVGAPQRGGDSEHVRPRPHTPGTSAPTASTTARRNTSTQPGTSTVIVQAVTPPAPLPPAAPGLVPGRVTVVGDSVTIDAAPALQAIIPGVQVDAEVGMQWETGVQVLQQLRSSGQLGAVVVVALGTNGPVSVAQFQQMMSVLQGVSRIVFVTNHAPDWWEEQNNAMFESEVPHYATARIANWDAAAKANPQWLYSDGTHMPIGQAGAYAWAELVKAQI